MAVYCVKVISMLGLVAMATVYGQGQSGQRLRLNGSPGNAGGSFVMDNGRPARGSTLLSGAATSLDRLRRQQINQLVPRTSGSPTAVTGGQGSIRGQGSGFSQQQQQPAGPQRVVRLSREQILQLQRDQQLRRQKRLQQQEQLRQQQQQQQQKQLLQQQRLNQKRQQQQRQQQKLQQQQQQGFGRGGGGSLTRGGLSVSSNSRLPVNVQVAKLDRSGRIVPLTPAEREEYLRGKLSGQTVLSDGRQQQLQRRQQQLPPSSSSFGNANTNRGPGFPSASLSSQFPSGMARNPAGAREPGFPSSNSGQVRNPGQLSRLQQRQLQQQQEQQRLQQQQEQQRLQQQQEQERLRQQQENQRLQQQQENQRLQRQRQQRLLLQQQQQQQQQQQREEELLRQQELQRRKEEELLRLQRKRELELQQLQLLQQQQEQQQQQQLQQQQQQQMLQQQQQQQQQQQMQQQQQQQQEQQWQQQQQQWQEQQPLEPTVPAQAAPSSLPTVNGDLGSPMNDMTSPMNEMTSPINDMTSSNAAVPASPTDTALPASSSIVGNDVSAVATDITPRAEPVDPVVNSVHFIDPNAAGAQVKDPVLAKRERIHQLADLLGFQPLDFLNVANKNSLGGPKAMMPETNQVTPPVPIPAAAQEPVSPRVSPPVFGSSNKIDMAFVVGMQNSARPPAPGLPMGMLDNAAVVGNGGSGGSAVAAADVVIPDIATGAGLTNNVPTSDGSVVDVAGVPASSLMDVAGVPASSLMDVAGVPASSLMDNAGGPAPSLMDVAGGPASSLMDVAGGPASSLVDVAGAAGSSLMDVAGTPGSSLKDVAAVTGPSMVDVVAAAGGPTLPNDAKINTLIRQMAADMLTNRITLSKVGGAPSSFDPYLANRLVTLLGGTAPQVPPTKLETPPSMSAVSNIGPMTSAPSNIGPMTSAPSNIGPMTSAPSNIGPMTSAPSNIGPMTSAPSNSVAGVTSASNSLLGVTSGVPRLADVTTANLATVTPNPVGIASAPVTAGNQTAGAVTGASPGGATGMVPGGATGVTSGVSSGVTSGVTSGGATGVTPGVTSGVTPGVTPGVTTGVTPGGTAGMAPGGATGLAPSVGPLTTDPVIQTVNQQLASLAENVIQALLSQTASGAMPKGDPLVTASQALLTEIQYLTNVKQAPAGSAINAISNNNNASAIMTSSQYPTSNVTGNATGLFMISSNTTFFDTASNFTDMANLTGIDAASVNLTTASVFTTTTTMVTSTTPMLTTVTPEPVPTPPPPPPGMPHMFEALPGQGMTSQPMITMPTAGVNNMFNNNNDNNVNNLHQNPSSAHAPVGQTSPNVNPDLNSAAGRALVSAFSNFYGMQASQAEQIVNLISSTANKPTTLGSAAGYVDPTIGGSVAMTTPLTNMGSMTMPQTYPMTSPVMNTATGIPGNPTLYPMVTQGTVPGTVFPTTMGQMASTSSMFPGTVGNMNAQTTPMQYTIPQTNPILPGTATVTQGTGQIPQNPTLIPSVTQTSVPTIPSEDLQMASVIAQMHNLSVDEVLLMLNFQNVGTTPTVPMQTHAAAVPPNNISPTSFMMPNQIHVPFANQVPQNTGFNPNIQSQSLYNPSTVTQGTSIAQSNGNSMGVANLNAPASTVTAHGHTHQGSHTASGLQHGQGTVGTTTQYMYTDLVNDTVMLESLSPNNRQGLNNNINANINNMVNTAPKVNVHSQSRIDMMSPQTSPPLLRHDALHPTQSPTSPGPNHAVPWSSDSPQNGVPPTETALEVLNRNIASLPSTNPPSDIAKLMSLLSTIAQDIHGTGKQQRTQLPLQQLQSGSDATWTPGTQATSVGGGSSQSGIPLSNTGHLNINRNSISGLAGSVSQPAPSTSMIGNDHVLNATPGISNGIQLDMGTPNGFIHTTHNKQATPTEATPTTDTTPTLVWSAFGNHENLFDLLSSSQLPSDVRQTTPTPALAPPTDAAANGGMNRPINHGAVWKKLTLDNSGHLPGEGLPNFTLGSDQSANNTFNISESWQAPNSTGDRTDSMLSTNANGLPKTTDRDISIVPMGEFNVSPSAPTNTSPVSHATVTDSNGVNPLTNPGNNSFTLTNEMVQSPGMILTPNSGPLVQRYPQQLQHHNQQQQQQQHHHQHQQQQQQHQQQHQPQQLQQQQQQRQSQPLQNLNRPQHYGQEQQQHLKEQRQRDHQELPPQDHIHHQQQQQSKQIQGQPEYSTPPQPNNVKNQTQPRNIHTPTTSPPSLLPTSNTINPAHIKPTDLDTDQLTNLAYYLTTLVLGPGAMASSKALLYQQIHTGLLTNQATAIIPDFLLSKINLDQSSQNQNSSPVKETVVRRKRQTEPSVLSTKPGLTTEQISHLSSWLTTLLANSTTPYTDFVSIYTSVFANLQKSRVSETFVPFSIHLHFGHSNQLSPTMPYVNGVPRRIDSQSTGSTGTQEQALNGDLGKVTAIHNNAMTNAPTPCSAKEAVSANSKIDNQKAMTNSNNRQVSNSNGNLHGSLSNNMSSLSSESTASVHLLNTDMPGPSVSAGNITLLDSPANTPKNTVPIHAHHNTKANDANMNVQAPPKTSFVQQNGTDSVTTQNRQTQPNPNMHSVHNSKPAEKSQVQPTSTIQTIRASPFQVPETFNKARFNAMLRKVEQYLAKNPLLQDSTSTNPKSQPVPASSSLANTNNISPVVSKTAASTADRTSSYLRGQTRTTSTQTNVLPLSKMVNHPMMQAFRQKLLQLQQQQQQQQQIPIQHTLQQQPQQNTQQIPSSLLSFFHPQTANQNIPSLPSSSKINTIGSTLQSVNTFPTNLSNKNAGNTLGHTPGTHQTLGVKTAGNFGKPQTGFPFSQGIQNSNAHSGVHYSAVPAGAHTLNKTKYYNINSTNTTNSNTDSHLTFTNKLKTNIVMQKIRSLMTQIAHPNTLAPGIGSSGPSHAGSTPTHHTLNQHGNNSQTGWHVNGSHTWQTAPPHYPTLNHNGSNNWQFTRSPVTSNGFVPLETTTPMPSPGLLTPPASLKSDPRFSLSSQGSGQVSEAYSTIAKQLNMSASQLRQMLEARAVTPTHQHGYPSAAPEIPPPTTPWTPPETPEPPEAPEPGEGGFNPYAFMHMSGDYNPYQYHHPHQHFGTGVNPGLQAALMNFLGYSF